MTDIPADNQNQIPDHGVNPLETTAPATPVTPPPTAPATPATNDTPDTFTLKKGDEKTSPPSKKGKPSKAIALATILLLLASLPVGLALVKQRQEIRKEANECDPTCDLNGDGIISEEEIQAAYQRGGITEMVRCSNQTCAETSPNPTPTGLSLLPNGYQCIRSDQCQSGYCNTLGSVSTCQESCEPGAWDETKCASCKEDPTQPGLGAWDAECTNYGEETENKEAWCTCCEKCEVDKQRCINHLCGITPTPPACRPCNYQCGDGAQCCGDLVCGDYINSPGQGYVCRNPDCELEIDCTCEAAPGSPTPPPPACQCIGLDLYTTSNQPLDPSEVEAGMTVRIFVKGNLPAQQQKGRIRINSGAWQELTSANFVTSLGYFKEYTLPSGGGTFNLEGQICCGANAQNCEWK